MASSQVRIQLSTRQADLEFSEKTGPILIKTNFARYQLSTLVNNLLTSPTPIPFDFLINGTFLRTSLDEFLTSHGISAETTLNIEYIRAQLPPTTQASFEHDDWVASVDVLSASAPACVWAGDAAGVQKGQERILSGSYDDLLRVWDMSGRVLATSAANPNAGRVQHVLAAKFISPTSIVASSGSRLQLWRYHEERESTTGAPVSQATLTQTLELLNHTMSINSLAVHAPSRRILSASDDCTAALWSTSSTASSHGPVPAALVPLTQQPSKRRKLSTPTSAAPSVPSAGPLLTLIGHAAPVTATIFHPTDPTAAYTTSRDFTLRTWDLETSTCVTSRTPVAHNPLTALCPLPSLHLLALGTAYSTIALMDPRESTTSTGGRTVIQTLKGHRNDISSLAQNPRNGFGLASGSYDGTVRVWDVRNTRGAVDGAGGEGDGVMGNAKVGRAAFRIPRKGNAKCDEVEGGQGVKVFDLCWDREAGLVSGGEDKCVQVDRE